MKIITFEVYAVANLFDGAGPMPIRNECAGMRKLMNTFHVDNLNPRVFETSQDQKFLRRNLPSSDTRLVQISQSQLSKIDRALIKWF